MDEGIHERTAKHEFIGPFIFEVTLSRANYEKFN